MDWNDTVRPYPAGVRLHQLFEEQALRSPEAVALRFRGEDLSFGELDRRANRLAHHLRSLGVSPEVLVGISVERSFEMVVGLLGILKAGGAYVPLDPEYPADRLEFMAADAQVPVLLTQEHLRERVSDAAPRILCLDADWGDIAKNPEEKPPELAAPENLAYVIFTSGSTGRPKGAMNEHRGICNRLFWMQEEYNLAASDTVLQKTPFSFDVSVWEFFWPLMTGARLVLADPGGHKDANYLAGLIQREGVTVLHFVPSMLQIFLDEENLEERCSSLRDVICSGEALPFDLQERFFSRLGSRLHNLYGPTEAAVDVTYWPCTRGGTDRVVPIGYPVANTQIHILDDNLGPTVGDTPGELHIGGLQVGRGYWNRPELTDERFIPDPFRAEPNARLYKSGDLARRRPDGAVEFLGRIDHQVKIRGNRVELGEIEAVLSLHPGIKQAAVLAREDKPGDLRLVAYLLAVNGTKPSVTDLRQHLQDTLPDYMVPSVYVLLDSMPLSPNGKVDRRALPAPSRQRPELDEAYLAPRTALEELLAGIWRDVLDIDEVGVNDRFFELGGTSLQAAQFINRVQKEIGEFIYVVTIFEFPTISEYASFLLRDYGPSVARQIGEGLAPGAGGHRAEGSATERRRIDHAAIEQMRSAIPVRSEWGGEESEAVGAKNPQALFVLSPPRSGTTLLRVMLAGHPGLFAAAELQLLGFNTLQERRRAFTGKYGLWLEGTIRAIMEIKACDADEAKAMMAGYEAEGYTTRRFYALLQEWLGQKMLIDKSPAYASDPRALEKAERDFEDALYIHLVRHPYAMVRSFERYHMDQVLFLNDHPFSSRELGELIWTISHQNVVQFLEGVPEHRKYRLRFEDLVRDPRKEMEELCTTLGLEFHSSLVEPYQDLDKKMTDGIYSDSTPMGDTKLLERKGIDPAVADSWRGVLTDDFLGDPTWEMAVSLGYDPPPVGDHAASDASDRRRGFAERQKQLRQRREARRGQMPGRSEGVD